VARHNLALLACFLVYLSSVLGAVTLWMSILESLNTRRSPEDQIPVFKTRWRDHTWWMDHFAKYGPFSTFRVFLPEYRREFPESRTPVWFIFCLTILCIDVGLAAVLLSHWYA
jgi:hypothetical protein